MSFDEVYRLVRFNFESFWFASVTGSLAAFGDELRANPVIRMWADGAPGYGHQSSTITILRQFVAPVQPGSQGFGYQGRIQLYYPPEYQGVENGPETLAKLKKLLPELRGAASGQVGGARVELHAWQDGQQLSERKLGFTGGADDLYEEETWIPVNFAARINVRYFLRIQPYRFPMDEQIQFNADRQPLVLTRQRALQYGTFAERAYYLPPVQEPMWANYAADIVGETTARQADLVQRLTMGHIDTPPRAVCPVYGIRSYGRGWNLQLMPPAAERMFEVITAILATQRSPGGTNLLPGMRSVALVSCDDFDANEEDAEALEQLLKGGLSAAEASKTEDIEYLSGQWEPDEGAIAQAQAFIDSGLPRKQWVKLIKASKNVDYVSGLDETDEVGDGLEFLDEPGRVTMFQIGRLPPPLFAWCVQQAWWPAVFEGQGSASLALNVGKLYLHIARQGYQSVLYPAKVVGYEPATQPTGPETQAPARGAAPVPRRMQTAANQLNTPLTPWPADPARAPAEVVASLVRQYYEETATSAGGPLTRYLDSVRRYYSDARNDKLRVALAFLEYTMSADGGQDAPDAAASVLDTLLRDLKDNTASNTTLVAPGALNSGGIYDYYTSFPGSAGLVITGSSIDPVPATGPLTAVVVTGTTTSLAGMALTATLTFTAPQGSVLVCEGRYESAERWAIPQIPWIGFSHPFLEVYLTDTGAPPEASIGGTLDGTGAELAFRLPVAEGMWQLAAGLDPHHHPISGFYQLAGGVNLVRALPGPFAGLAGFGLEHVQLVYDETAGQVDYVSLRMATADSFTLVGDVSVQSISAEVTVQQPGSLTGRHTDWTVQGTFTLGTGKDPAVIVVSALGPDLVLSGSLASGVLTISDVIAAFCPGVRPDLPHEPVLTEFRSWFTPATGDYQVSCYLNLDWPVTVAGHTSFTIKAVTLVASSVAGIVTGQLTGFVVIDPDGQAVPLELIAGYATASGWTFMAVQAAGSEFSLSGLFAQFLPSSWKVSGTSYGIADLRVTAAVNEGSWEVSGRTAGAWTVPFIAGLDVSAALQLGYRAAAGGAAAAEAAAPGYYGRLDTQWRWHGIELSVFFDYSPQASSYGISWGGLTGLVSGPVNPDGDYVATLRFSDQVTIGSMIETMVSWATGARFALEAPWDLLGSIALSGLALTYTFNSKYPERNTVAFTVDIGPVELGFARIDGITVSYDDKAEQRVAVTLTGSFPWNTGTGAAGSPAQLGPWDAAEPGATPAPPGGGGKYLDLRLLSLGQHVTDPELAAASTVQKAIALMADMPAPEPGTVPTVTFDPTAGWIIGADLGLVRLDADESGGAGRPAGTVAAAPAGPGYLVTVQVVFNDPRLYALRLALDGEAALIFRGLDFQVSYRQVSDTVGVYQAEITLPDSMRHLSIGACAVTLPVVAVAVYTNGDFQVDVGFPWNGDFARSFSIEAIVFPGLPATGAGGFYFGRLSSATTDRVPQVTNGTFSPVLAFGLGLQLGFGKSVQYGPLKAGFSVTATGIVEGILASFRPFAPPAAQGAVAPAEVQGSYYFWLRGTLGITGRLYGSIDFSVVKADVNVAFSVLLQVTYESYATVTITVIVAVDVSVSVRIDLGLFSVRISFSFALRIEESFSIENGGSPPWVTAGAALTSRSLTAGRRPRGLPGRRLAGTAAAGRWDRLAPSTTKQQLAAWLVPGLTVAADEWRPGEAGQQVPCYVLLPLIESVADSDGGTEEVVALTAAASTDTSFELLAKMVLRWVIAAGQGSELTPEAADQLVVAEADLTALLQEVLVSTDTEPVPISPADVNAFLTGQFVLTMAVPDGAASGPQHATSFPMPPALSVRAQLVGGGDYPVLDYSLDGYNALDQPGVADLREYFSQLAVQVAQEQSGPSAPPSAEDAVAGSQLSVAQWVQSDYFLLLARQMTQAALDSLRDFRYLAGNSTPAEIVRDVNTTGKLTGVDALTVAALFAANSATALLAGAELTLGPEVAAADGDSFDSVATTQLGGAVTASGLATANAGRPALLRPGTRITCQGAHYDVAAGDSLITVARGLRVRFADLLSGSPGLLDRTDLLISGARLLASLVSCQVRTGSTFQTLADGYPSGGLLPLTGRRLAEQNAAGPVLRDGVVIHYGDLLTYTTGPGDCLADVAMHFGVSLAELLDKSDVVRQEGLLAEVAMLSLPAFRYKAAAGESLGSVAARLAASTEILAMAPDNAAIPNLFATSGTTGTGAWVGLPPLPQYQVGAIIGEIQRTLGIRQLSGMAARYALSGTRLPTRHIVPLRPGMWVRDAGGALTLPATAGLYALTGQQLPVPQLASGQSFNITISNTRPDDLAWLKFADGGTKLPVHVEPGSTDANRIAKVTAEARKGPFEVPLATLGADPMYQRQPASYPLTTMTEWSCPAVLTLPYGPAPKPDHVQRLRLWTLPAALRALPDPGTPGKTAPRFAIRLTSHDEATGATSTTDIGAHAWASVVEFTVQKVPLVANSPATADSYEILGAGGAQAAVLQRMVTEIGDSGYYQLLLAFPPDATGASPGTVPASTSPTTGSGLQTDPQGAVVMGISQVNLSTQTRPPVVGAVQAAQPASGAARLLNTPAAFVRLLWEASITRAGGFYLYYHDGTESRGLPERIFSDRGDARVSLIALYPAPVPPAAQDRLTDYMTAVVTADATDLTGSGVIAEAAPMEPAVAATPELTVARLAELTYSDIADLAADNSGLSLATGVQLTVTGGVYQAPPGGIAAAEVARQYGTTVDALNQANPRWTGGLPADLPGLTAVWLPPLTLTANTSPHTSTLADLAGYYGIALASLAAANAGVPGLFKGGQQVTVAGGPLQRTATVVPGSASVAVTRPRPGDVPVDPNTSGYATQLLASTFTMLSCTLDGNVYFEACGAALPVSPATADAAAAAPAAHAGAVPDGVAARNARPYGKVRVAAAGDTWDYRQSLPYARFALPAVPGPAGLPAASGDPYRGLGAILQPGYTWQDYYGNTLVTSLTPPQLGSKPPYNRQPQVTGYTDLLIGLGQWPSVSPSWRVLGADGSARLELLLSFDPTGYQGLISASASGADVILARFTDPLDPVSATSAGSYRLDHGATVVSASLAADGLAVTLVTGGPLAADREHLLSASVQGVPGTSETRPSYSGSVTFRSTGTGQGTSSLAERAARDLGCYAALYYQLTDANGIAAEIATSMLAEPAAMTPAQWTALLDWLFSGSPAVYAFLADRAAGGTTAPVPAAVHAIGVELDRTRLNRAEISELWVTLTLRRTGGQVLPGLDTTAGITSARTVLPPLSEPVDDQGTLGLTTFAREFEAALSVPGSHVLKVATGVNRYAAAVTGEGTGLWAVRIGTVPGTGISYQITSEDTPELYAPRPVSNQLQSRQAVPIYDYDLRKGGISASPTRKLSFSDIDLDLWGRALLAGVDNTLTPQFVSPMRLVTEKQRESDPGAPDYLQQILDQKKLLAAAVSTWMIPLYGDPAADPGPVREEFYQQLLSRLSNAYTVAAGIQYRADVTASIDDGPGTVAPRLFGDVLDEASVGLNRSEISLSSPKLPLRTGSGEPLPILLTAPQTVSRDGVVTGSLGLALRWAAASIEHQVAVPDPAGYSASSWLSFVVPGEPDEPGSLAAPLGRVDVPLVLRSFPASPAMTGQSGTPEHQDSADLAALRAWTYTLTWSLPFHYEQDRIHGSVEFNLRTVPAGQQEDLFPALAEFITVYPDVRADLDAIVGRVEASTTDPRVIKDAGVTLASFVRLLDGVTKVIAGPSGASGPSGPSGAGSGAGGGLTVATPQPAMAGDPALTYGFSVAEGAAEIEGPSGPVRALQVTIGGTVPAGMGTPVVLVDPGRYEPVPATGGGLAYCYADRETGEYLLEADAQQLPQRTLVLPGLDVLQRQNAWAGIYLTRNELIMPGQPPLADEFVYKTALSRFADPMAPSVGTAVPVDIARTGAAGPQRSLEEHFRALFGALFTDLPPDAALLIIAAEIVYRYQLVAGPEPVELPVFLQAPTGVTVTGPGSTLAAMITAWSEAIRSWFDATPPSGADGRLHLDLTILSSLTASQMPLLRLRGLFLAVADVAPPLHTAS